MNFVQYILNKEVDLKKKIDLATHKGAIRITSIYNFHHQLTLRIRTHCLPMQRVKNNLSKQF